MKNVIGALFAFLALILLLSLVERFSPSAEAAETFLEN
jgi:hypothetical protein